MYGGAFQAARDVTRVYGAGETAVHALRGVTLDVADGLTEPEVPAFVQLPVLTAVTGHDIAVAYGKPQRHDSTGPAEYEEALWKARYTNLPLPACG